MLGISAAQLKLWFQTDLGGENSASYDRQGRQFTGAENSCSILNHVYFDSWSWQSFLSTCDVFNCLFPLDVQNEIQLLSGVFCYSWLVCLLGFWLRNTSLVKVSISFDMSLQNFKKPLDIFPPQIERKRSKEYWVLILAVKESFERFSCLEFKRSKHREAILKHKLKL